MDPKVREVSQIFDRFKSASVRKDFDTCVTLLSQLKVLLTDFKSLPPLFEDTPNAVHELSLARDIYEHAVVLSVKIEDQDAFERDFFQLKPYYTDAHGRLPPSPQEYPILGLNLLRLLVQNRIAEFHTELELLSPSALENPCIRHAIELEQSFMEGAYNRVLSARQTVPHETYLYFMDLLAKTVRDEIAGCSEKAYDSLSVKDAGEMLLFSSDTGLLPYIAEEHPEWEVKNGSVIFQRAPCSREIPSLQLINQTLSYARELERIVKELANSTVSSFMASKKDPQQASNADEYLLQQTLHFAESLKDLKSIRAQMYSAAEHFELSYYKNNDQQQLVEDTLKDYICKAVISTVDHLGSVACKVASFLDEKVDEISSASLLFSGIEQRLRAHQQFIDLSGLSRQLLVPDTAKHYKRYSVTGLKGHDKMKLQSIRSDCVLYPQVDSQMQRHNQDDHIAKAFQVAGSKSKAPLLRKGHSGPRSDEVSRKPKSFSFMRAASIKEIGKRAVSPLKFPVQRSGPFDNRSTSPSAIDIKQRCPSEPRRHKRELTNLERSKGKDIEVYSRKSKHLFRALLSIHVSRKQGVPNRFSGGK